MPLPERAAQEHDFCRGHRAVNVVCDGEVCRHDGDLSALAEGTDKLEASGACVHKHRLARLDERGGNARDGSLGLNVHVHAKILYRHRERARKRDRAAVRAAQLAVACEGIKICSRGDARHAKGICHLGNLHG